MVCLFNIFVIRLPQFMAYLKKKEKSKISLVTHLKNFEEILNKTKKNPNIDLKKVNKLKKAIQDGKYEIDFERLAEKILKEY